MSSKEIDAQIRARIDQFLTDVQKLLRESALHAVQEALGGAPARRPAAQAPSAVAASQPKRGGKRGRRSSVNVDDLRGRVTDALRRNPGGMRMEQLSTALGTESALIKKAILVMLKDGQVSKTGEKRATTYFAK